MSALLLLLSFPTLYWTEGVKSAPALKRAGIERLAVPSAEAKAWRDAGFSIIPLSRRALSAREKLQTPGLAVQMGVASATTDPWVFANGWRFLRHGKGRYYYDRLPAGTATLAAAETLAYGADAVLTIDPTDLEDIGRLSAFVKEMPALELPGIADLAVVDDGSPATGEVMNLLARRNLLFRVVSAPSPEFPINVQLGRKEYPKSEAADPSAFAQKIRRQLTDEGRTLRVYGSNVVICRPTGDTGRARIHVLNYGRRPIEGLRLRLRGAYAEGEAFVAGRGRVALRDHVVAEGATEFSLPSLGVYAVIDLARARSSE
jgi:hypothetical protein